MSREINYETNDRHDHLVHIEVKVPLNGGVFTFVQPLPAYIHGKLKCEDWEEIGVLLREHAESTVHRMAISGDYFMPGGVEAAKRNIVQAAREFIHRKFVQRNNEAGNLEWAVPSLLKGEQYA